MTLAINKLGDPVLRCRATETERDEKELARIVSAMAKTLKKAKGLGLAAPQVGILKRLFIYDLGDGVEVMINPVIVGASEETCEDTEGCLSIPGFEVTVVRAAGVTVEAEDAAGLKKVVEAEGLMARMFQHEIDHLDGILIIDRTSDEERRAVMKALLREDTR